MSKFPKMVSAVLRYLVFSLAFAILFYALFALFFSTAEESRLARENRLYASMFKEMSEREELIEDVIDGLVEKDGSIYETLFSAKAPSLDNVTAAEIIADSDSLSESFYLASAETTAGKVLEKAASVDRRFADIFALLSSRADSIPPLTRPLENLSYVQTGASVGQKHNPVHGLELRHDGLDLIAPQGTPVYAAANGVVCSVTRTHRGLGNTVEIDHGNGYKTRYCLLGDVFTSRGKHVKQGQRIGTVGITPSVSAPHLHYEVYRDSVVLDPVNHLFASITPEEYSKMLYLSASTTQAMD